MIVKQFIFLQRFSGRLLKNISRYWLSFIHTDNILFAFKIWKVNVLRME